MNDQNGNEKAKLRSDIRRVLSKVLVVTQFILLELMLLFRGLFRIVVGIFTGFSILGIFITNAEKPTIVALVICIALLIAYDVIIALLTPKDTDVYIEK